MGTFIRSFATLNINGLRLDAKLSLLKDFLWNNDVDIMTLQEVNVDFLPTIKGYEVVCNPGEGGRGTAWVIRESITYDQMLLSMSGRVTSLVADGVNFVGIYAPSGSGKRAERREFFLGEVADHLLKSGVSTTVLAGDFNCVLGREDNRGDSFNDCVGLRTLVRDLGLVDAWREAKGSQTTYTFIRGKAASRIDRIYCPKGFSERIRGISVKPVVFSDHCALIMNFEISAEAFTAIPRRRPWKLAPHLLYDSLRMERVAAEIIRVRGYRKYLTDFGSWWSDHFKTAIRKFFSNEARQFYESVRRERKSYEDVLSDWFRAQGDGGPLMKKFPMQKCR